MLPPFTALIRRWAPLQRWWGVAVLLLAWLLVMAGGTQAQTGTRWPPVLDAGTQAVDLWPAVSVLPDPGATLSLEEALAHRFEPPRTAHATLGMRPEPMWLRMPFSTAPEAATSWVLDIDYPALNHIDVYLLQEGQVIQRAALGNLQIDPDRPRAARAHTELLRVQPGQSFELVLRVQTSGALVLPITLNRPDEFLARALREQMLQGLMVCLSLCLVLYSLTMWRNLRDAAFGKYALVVGGGMLLSMLQFGVGAQFIWSGNLWMELHVGALAALTSAVGFFLFFEHMLALPGQHRLFSRTMKAGAALAVVVGLVYAAGGLSTRAVSPVVGLLGIAPMLLALPLTFQHMRQGNPLGRYMLLAVLVYFIATATMVGVLFDRIGVNFWTHHSIQLAGMLDAMLLMRMLSLRTQAARRAAHRATLERDAMRSLAHTDPLTHLPNRRGLNAALAKVLPLNEDAPLAAVYVIDLDGFKPINDQHGHDVGDELLVAVARRLQHLVRNDDVVARVGGDEFVVVVSGLQRASQAAELGEKMLDAFSQPFRLGDIGCQIGLTIGYALAPLDGNNAKALLKMADESMYRGKHAGKHCLQRATPTQTPTTVTGD